MFDYEVIASHCDPYPQCPKVARGTPGRVAVVGEAITHPEALAALGVGPGEAAVEITETLYRAGHEGLQEKQCE